MTDEPTGWVTPAYRSNKHVFHTDDECRKLPFEGYVRPLGENEIVSRDLRQCSVCENQDCTREDGTRTRECPWCGDSVYLRSHLPCSDEGGGSDE